MYMRSGYDHLRSTVGNLLARIPYPAFITTMKNSICLAIPAILIVSAGSFSRPAIAQIAPTAESPATEILPTPITPVTTPFANSASIGTIEVSPETKSEFQAQQQIPIATISLPDSSSFNIFDRIVAKTGAPTAGQPPFQPGQFDLDQSRSVGVILGEI
jgi:hypothetical protein